MTQGGVVSPTLFNIVVDALVCYYWLDELSRNGTIVEPGKVGVQTHEQLVCFYADDGLLAPCDADWLQAAFDHLIPIFERISLKTNAQKTKSMNFVPGYICTQTSSEAYWKRTLNEGLTFRERQRRATECPHCRKKLVESSLPKHLQMQHGIVLTQTYLPPSQPVDYRCSVPKVHPWAASPVPGYPYVAKLASGMQQHFLF